MPTRFFKMPPSAIKHEILRSLAKKTMLHDESQPAHLHEPTYCLERTEPITGEYLSTAENHPVVKDANFTICFSTIASRKALQDIPYNHPNVRLPYSAANDSDHSHW